jgi:hypothetical protein
MLLVTILVKNLLLVRWHGHVVIKTEGVTGHQVIPRDTFLLLFMMLSINHLGSDALLSSQNGTSFLICIRGINCGCTIP